MMSGGGSDGGFYAPRNRGIWDVIDRHRFSIIVWTTAIILILFVWHFISDKDFSFLMVRWCSAAVRRTPSQSLFLRGTSLLAHRHWAASCAW